MHLIACTRATRLRCEIENTLLEDIIRQLTRLYLLL